MKKPDTTKKVDPYEAHFQETLRHLEEKHGREWVKKNRARLEKDRQFFEEMNLL